MDRAQVADIREHRTPVLYWQAGILLAGNGPALYNILAVSCFMRFYGPVMFGYQSPKEIALPQSFLVSHWIIRQIIPCKLNIQWSVFPVNKSTNLSNSETLPQSISSFVLPTYQNMWGLCDVFPPMNDPSLGHVKHVLFDASMKSKLVRGLLN